jgi:hypothetical protein
MKARFLFILLPLAAVWLLTGCTSNAPSESPGPPNENATHLIISSVPSQLTANATFTVSVQALRSDNTVDPDYMGFVAIEKASGPGVLAGTLMKEAEAGTVMFDDLIVDVAGTYTFRVTAVDLMGDTTAPIIVEPSTSGPATKLGFVAVPSEVTEGMPFSLMVQAQREDNSLDPSYAGAIAISLASGPGMLQGNLTVQAVGGVATFNALVLSEAGTYTFMATSGSLTGTSGPIVAVAAAPMVVKTGTFSGQNGYSTVGTVEVVRNTDGVELLRTGTNFAVSSGAGSIGVWLTNATGAASLNSTSEKLRVGLITSGFSGAYEYSIPGGLGSYTHVVTFCEGAQINFGNAELRDP